MKKYTLIILFIQFSTSVLANDSYTLLFESVNNILGVKAHNQPKIDLVKKNKWVYPSISRYECATNTIYILEGNESVYIIAHEMAHAVVTQHTMLNPLPEKMQEILAGYVEYEIRKQDYATPILSYKQMDLLK